MYLSFIKWGSFSFPVYSNTLELMTIDFAFSKMYFFLYSTHKASYIYLSLAPSPTMYTWNKLYLVLMLPLICYWICLANILVKI